MSTARTSSAMVSARACLCYRGFAGGSFPQCITVAITTTAEKPVDDDEGGSEEEEEVKTYHVIAN